MRSRTALAKFIDLSALWGLCLMAWFYVLLGRIGRLYPALLMACACAASTLGLVALVRRALMARRRGMPDELVRQLSAHIALMPQREALDALGAWLKFGGVYGECAREGDALSAVSADGRRIRLALIQVWPGERTGVADLLAAWRHCGGYGERDGAPLGTSLNTPLNSSLSAPLNAVVSTAELTPGAVEVARELGMAVVPPGALSAVMRAALPVCADARGSRGGSPRANGALRTLRAIVSRANAGRFGAYALGLSVAGRVLGLGQFRAAGLCCAAMWVLCAAQARTQGGSAWPQ